MKSSWSLQEDPHHDYRIVLEADHREIDNPNPKNRYGLHYMGRFNKIHSAVTRHFPNAIQTKVGEFGCAQGNMSLLLAESGYEVYAVDIDSARIEYSKRKYEKGKIQWIVGNVETLDFPGHLLDVAILGEMLSVCAYPETILRKVMHFVRPGGLLIITVPNGDRIKMTWPTPRKARQRGGQEDLEQKQFIFDNLFSFSLQDIKAIVPQNATILESAFCGSTCLINKYSQGLIGLFPLSLIESSIGVLARIPLLNRKTFHTLCVVLQKRRTDTA